MYISDVSGPMDFYWTKKLWHQLIQVHQNATPRSNPCRHDGFLGDSLNFPQPLKHRNSYHFFEAPGLLVLGAPQVDGSINGSPQRRNDFPCGNLVGG